MTTFSVDSIAKFATGYAQVKVDAYPQRPKPQ